jgi:hypothetical protein
MVYRDRAQSEQKQARANAEHFKALENWGVSFAKYSPTLPMNLYYVLLKTHEQD